MAEAIETRPGCVDFVCHVLVSVIGQVECSAQDFQSFFVGVCSGEYVGGSWARGDVCRLLGVNLQPSFG